MTIVYTDVQTAFAEWSATSQPTIEAAIAEAELLCREGFYGVLYDKAILWMTAHILKDDANVTAGSANHPGVKQSESLDGYSVTWAVKANPSDFDAWLASTAYGQKVAAYRRKGVRPMRMTGTTL